ncbi:MAG: hypothetical protein KBD56_01160 [Candidatus Eisenbacteria bacterium]|nr:hypothetical protein [Candidatus Eisenbacteria bacterium]
MARFIAVNQAARIRRASRLRRSSSGGTRRRFRGVASARKKAGRHAYCVEGIAILVLLLSNGSAFASAGEPRAFEGTLPAHPAIELVESFPVETSLDHAGLRDASIVWREMIARARTSLDFAEFYASDTTASALGPIVAEVEAAARRGVRVRFLAEEKFFRTYPGTLLRLSRQAGIEVRLCDAFAPVHGVHHAKYFIVDGEEIYVGSQNFDWRALEHIVELGARVAEPAVAQAFTSLFERDWNRSRENALPVVSDPRGETFLEDSTPSTADEQPARLFPAERFPVAIPLAGGSDTAWVTPVFSPRDELPEGALWDLPEIVRMIDSARASVRVQLLTYSTRADEPGEPFSELEDALLRAAARGARVELLLSDWCKREGIIEGLQALARGEGIQVRMVEIPPASTGFIPYARVIHAKYMIVDGHQAWIGTGNWEGDYFLASRNAGLCIRSASLGLRLESFFLDLWESAYAKPVDPSARYTPPRIRSAGQ